MTSENIDYVALLTKKKTKVKNFEKQKENILFCKKEINDCKSFYEIIK